MFILRPAKSSDYAFIASSWFLNANQCTPHEVFKEMHNKLIEYVTNRAMTICAVSKEDNSLILGWTCFEVYHKTPVIHFVYVKTLYRKSGIATALLGIVNGSDFYYTNKPHSKVTGGIYAPYLLSGDFYGRDK